MSTVPAVMFEVANNPFPKLDLPMVIMKTAFRTAIAKHIPLPYHFIVAFYTQRMLEYYIVIVHELSL